MRNIFSYESLATDLEGIVIPPLRMPALRAPAGGGGEPVAADGGMKARGEGDVRTVTEGPMEEEEAVSA
jgi:hypothetical protein